ncbi:MAG: copper amine oxidase N-terminal domain-containing protein [Bacillota bacterium]
MSRAAVTGLLVGALLIGVPGIGGANSAIPLVPRLPAVPAQPVTPSKHMAVTGILQYVDGPGHYEVNGYVLLGVKPDQLAPLLGRMVVVKGTLLHGPSIFMRQVLQVEEIGPHKTVELPAEPPHRLLFGRIEQDCHGFLLVEQAESSPVRLVGRDLSHLVGQLVAVAGTEEVRNESERVYRVSRVIPLSGDLTPYLGVVYYRPERLIQVRLDTRPLRMEQAPIMASGRTLVELRAVAEALKARLTWDGAAQQVTVERNDRHVTLQIGRTGVTVRESGQQLAAFQADVAPVLVGGRTMVPIRVLAEGLGLKVMWDPATWTVELS